MKKSLIFLLIILTSIAALSFNVNKVKDLYTSFIDEYSNLDEYILEGREGELEDFATKLDNLGAYRFYRNIMIGTAEYTDRPSNIQRYLSDLHGLLEFESPEERLAYAGFLGYIQSQLSGERLSRETIRSLPAYFTTVQDYKNNLENDALTYMGNVVAYALGIFDESPYKDIKRYDSDAEISNKDYYFYEGEPQDNYDEIITENKETLNEEIQKLYDEELTGQDLEFAIDDISYMFIGEINDLVDQQVQESLNMFVEEGDKAFAFGNFRWLIYLVVILLVFFMFRKLLTPVFLAIYSFEIIYLIFIFNPIQDLISSFIYGSYVILATAIFFIASLLKAFGRDVHIYERFKNIVVFISIILIITLPTYSFYDLMMQNNSEFKDSVFENQLLNDTIVYSHSPSQRTINSLKSDLGTEYSAIRDIYNSEFRNFLEASFENNIYQEIYADDLEIDVIINREGLSYKNVDDYRSSANSYANSINEVLDSAELRISRIEGNFSALEVNIENVLKYSSDGFEQKFKNQVENFFETSSVLKDIDISSYFNVEKLESIDLKLYNTVYGTIILVIFLFSLLLYVIFENKIIKIFTTVGMVIASIMAFITPQIITVIPQLKYPLLYSEDYSVNMIIGGLMLLITILIQIKKEKDLSEQLDKEN
ncbi:MAG: hypothetical protein ACQESN_01460 [Thermotogota bacterium]